MNVLPEGEELRRATNYILEEREYDPDVDLKELLAEACLRFDLSPKDAEFLSRFIQDLPKVE